MVQLIANKSSENVYLDLDDVSIKANYSAVEIQDITKRKSENTQVFTLPFTDTNNRFFSHFYNVNSSGDFNVNTRVEASVNVDSVEVLDGYLQLLKVNVKTNSYEVVILGEVANIVKSLGISKLSDLDLSEYNHDYSRANMVDSWDGAIEYSSGSTGDEILYPIIDYGYGFENILDAVDDKLSADKLKPAIKVQTLFNKILNTLGYSVNSNFINADSFFTNQYMTMAGKVKTLDTERQDGFRVYHPTNSTRVYSGSIQLIPFTIDSPSTISEAYNLDGNFIIDLASPEDGYYLVPRSGVYQFKITLYYYPKPLSTGSVDTYTHRVWVKRLVAGGTEERLEIITRKVNPDGGTMEYVHTPLELVEGDEIVFRFEDKSATADYVDLNYGSYVELIESPGLKTGSVLDLSADNALMPKAKQVDFLTSIISRYNLVMERDKDVPNQLNIEPIQTYLDGGSSKDWSGKLDEDKDFIIKPTHEFQNDSLNLTDLEDKDWLNTEWQESTKTNYGSFALEFSSDFTNGSVLEIKSIFSGFPIYDIGGMRMPQLYKWDNGSTQFVETKPKLFYYSGKKSCPTYRFYNESGSPSFTYYSEYPFCSTFSMTGSEITSTDVDIRFKSIECFGESTLISTATQNDTYKKCWEEYINGIYSPDARIVTAFFKLETVDIHNFKYSDKIFVKDAYYRINKIKSFSVGKDISTEVELIKIVRHNKTNPVIGCDSRVGSIDPDGTVNFVSGTGNAVNATRTCCESLGYRFYPGSSSPTCIASTSNNTTINTPPVQQDGGTITIGGEGDTVVIPGGDIVTDVSGKLIGDVYSENDILVLENGTTGSDAYFKGDIYASDGTSKILENGTDGTDATFTGDVTGDLTGTADIADKVYVTSSTASSNKYIPFVTNLNDADATLNTSVGLKYQPNIGLLTATRMNADKFVGDVYASNSSSKILDNGTTGADATITADVTNVQGTTILDVSVPQLNAAVVGNVTGNLTGNHFGDVYAANGVSRVLDNGTNGADATFKGDVIDASNNVILDPNAPQLNADVVGDVTGDVTGDLNGNIYTSSGSNLILGSGTDGTDAYFYGRVFNTAGVVLDPYAAGSPTYHGRVYGNVTGNLTGDVTGDLTGNVTATSVLADGVTATTQADGDDSTKVATTEYVQANKAEPGGTSSAFVRPIQYNENGSFSAITSFYYNTSSSVMHVPNISVSSSINTLTITASGNIGTSGTVNAQNISCSGTVTFAGLGTTTQTNVVGIDANGQLYEQPAGTGGGSPGGSTNSVQFNDGSGGFEGETNCTYNPTTNTLTVDKVTAVHKGDNIGTGIYAKGSTKYWYLGVTDFVNSSGSSTGRVSTVGNYMSMPSASEYYTAEFQVPVGYKVTKVFVKGNANVTFSVSVSGWSTVFGANKGSGTVNTELTLTNQLTESEGNFYTITVNPSSNNQRLYGCRLTLEEV